MINEAVSYRVLAEKRYAEIKRQQPKKYKTGPGRGKKGSGTKPKPFRDHKEEGISARSEQLSKIPDETIEQLKNKATAEGREFSTAEVLRENCSKLLAERRAGELLGQLKKSQGGDRSVAAASVAGVSEYAQTLKDTRTPERTAQYWQNVAEVPEETMQDYINETKAADDGEVTTRGLIDFNRNRA